MVGLYAAKCEDAAESVPHGALLRAMPCKVSLMLCTASLVHELGLALQDHFRAWRHRFFIEILVILDVADNRVRFIVLLATVLALEVKTRIGASP